MRKRKICVVTGTRAEYGLLYWLMKEINVDMIAISINSRRDPGRPKTLHDTSRTLPEHFQDTSGTLQDTTGTFLR